ncbi:hypothetical protein GYMLUDRAFT_512157 [Collybiopsis luxurians FD-317 M1]|nr:hypothetical protein GYMLUDRAFT_512157 [Collybiopsis luxurians FD-317 M1]
MPFDRTYQNPRIIGTLLTVRQGGKNLSINLDSCLGATNGKFYWGGREGFSAARNTSLSGSDLFGELKHNGQWLNDQIDLSTNIQVRGGKLVYVSRTRTPSRPRSPASSVGIRPVTPPV